MARTQAPDYHARRDAIISIAAELFARQGFRAASIADIAHACQASKSLFYHYFRSKEDLLHAVMASHIDELAAEVEQVTSAAGEPSARLRQLLHRFLRHYVGAVARQKVVLNELENLPAQKRDEVVATQRRIVALTERLVVTADPALAANPQRARVKTMLLFGMINWTHNWYDPAGPIGVDELADMVFAMFTGEREPHA